MGLHTLSPTPDDTGLGSKVQRLVGGLGVIKSAYDIGHTIYDVASFAAPSAARAMQASRAARRGSPDGRLAADPPAAVRARLGTRSKRGAARDRGLQSRKRATATGARH